MPKYTVILDTDSLEKTGTKKTEAEETEAEKTKSEINKAEINGTGKNVTEITKTEINWTEIIEPQKNRMEKTEPKKTESKINGAKNLNKLKKNNGSENLPKIHDQPIPNTPSSIIYQTAASESDISFMRRAIEEAKKASAAGDVPIGCVIVHEGEIIASAYNMRNQNSSVLAHAETLAIEQAAKKCQDFRLEDCTLYVTLEPCPMCAGAIVQARIPRVVIGTMNPKAGCAGSILNILQTPRLNHQTDVTVGVCREECSALLSDFFHELRNSDNEE